MFRLPWLALPLLLLLSGPAPAQPTYRLGVGADLQPRTTLELRRTQVVRGPLLDDPGFRVQFHFRQGDKTLATLDARTADRVELPRLEPGVYAVAVELFYPAFKGGTAQKGEFRPISPTLVYRIDPG